MQNSPAWLEKWQKALEAAAAKNQDPSKGRPDWLKIRARLNETYETVQDVLERHHLHTVCREANCPNRLECFGKGTATFLILGSVCTRNCTFCNITTGNPQPLDPAEPEELARAVRDLGLRHVVITSVTRDDLPDGGAAHFAETIGAVRQAGSQAVVEVLIPDFGGSAEALQTVVDQKPEIINHNIETVPRLYPKVRPAAEYDRSLELLARVREMDRDIYTKSGLMAGLGEKPEEVLEAISDLRQSGCSILTLGQYLAPSNEHYPILEYVHPELFDLYRQAAEAEGFLSVTSAPLVRSSYNAAELMERIQAG
ncbi:MAG: lipoyl synthase [Spirochaetales bacterium]|nr:lipoyl synthase [Spirochaetales bacterium]MCF7939172.1 lipoyl synthase [Spirochaetales bacterium]